MGNLARLQNHLIFFLIQILTKTTPKIQLLTLLANFRHQQPTTMILCFVSTAHVRQQGGHVNTRGHGKQDIHC